MSQGIHCEVQANKVGIPHLIKDMKECPIEKFNISFERKKKTEDGTAK
jgi:hypothetical protein